MVHRAATRGRVSRDVLEAHWPLWQGGGWSQIPPSRHRGLRREDRRTELPFLSGAQAPFSEGLASFSKYDLPILLCLFLFLSLTLRCLFPSALGLFRREACWRWRHPGRRLLTSTRPLYPHRLCPGPTGLGPTPSESTYLQVAWQSGNRRRTVEAGRGCEGREGAITGSQPSKC